MTSQYQPRNPNMRLSDSERADAMSALGRALAEGRLSMTEYDERISQVVAANTRGELAPLFTDIPQNPTGTTSTDVSVYSANEIAETHQRGQKTRAGLMGLSTVGAFGGMFIGLAAGVGGASTILLLLIPTVFILLYVMKVGPKSWYVPSPRQLERQRYREIQASQALEIAQRKADRKEQMDQITGDAMGIAQRALDRFKDKGSNPKQK